jgi:predicted signal transduction protein with EAL and GGDEF domain
MFGLMYLLSFIVFIGLIVAIILISYKLSKKYLKVGYPGFILGIIGVVAVCYMLFSDDIYKYYEFKHICETQTIDKVYDQEAYKKYNISRNKNEYPRIYKKELTNLKKELPIIDNEAYVAVVDKENNYIYFASLRDKKNNNSSNTKIINMNNNSIIYEYRDYWGNGGWFTKFISGSSGSSSFGSCSDNKLGVFKNK